MIYIYENSDKSRIDQYQVNQNGDIFRLLDNKSWKLFNKSPYFQTMEDINRLYIDNNWTLAGSILEPEEPKDYAWYKKQTELKTCIHEFKQYLGLSESFQYCIKCDVKRS